MATPRDEPFAAWLRYELDARGWTHRDLAHRLGVSPTVVPLWLAGATRPEPYARPRIAAALGVPESDLPPTPRRPRAAAPARPPAPFGAWLRGRRLARGWTQAELAARAGVSPSAVHGWETAGTRPSPARLAAVAAALGVPAAEAPGADPETRPRQPA